eukprot:365886-Chlamydomonas_euryale.AAC.6
MLIQCPPAGQLTPSNFCIRFRHPQPQQKATTHPPAQFGCLALAVPLDVLALLEQVAPSRRAAVSPRLLESVAPSSRAAATSSPAHPVEQVVPSRRATISPRLLESVAPPSRTAATNSPAHPA